MSKNLVITMSDDHYFENGDLFIETRKRVDADFVLYTPSGSLGLSKGKTEVCYQNDIDVQYVSDDAWRQSCQTMKFYYMKHTQAKGTKHITFCDFDTYFVKDWHSSVFDRPFFCIGVTLTRGYPQWKYVRSKTNGGVFFAVVSDATTDFFDNMIYTIETNGKCNEDWFHCVANNYVEIWKELENPNRKESKRHYKTNHAWWCDQIMLSALYLSESPGVREFDCSKYNALESDRNINDTRDVHIKHLKSRSRKKPGLIQG